MRSNIKVLLPVFLAATLLATPAFSDEEITASPEASPETSASNETKATDTVAETEIDADKPEAPSRGSIHYVNVEGIINPVSSEYIMKSLDAAAAAGAEVVIIQLDTPGGLDLSMRDIIKAIFASDVPVVVYVAPSGSRAASAGVFIAYSAHVAAMAPGTNIGSAHPVAMGGGEMDEVMLKKVENDAAAYIKSIAKKRGRNEEWAEEAVRESVNITAEEALDKNVIDIVAASRSELIEALDGRIVDMPVGEVTLETEGAEVVEVEMDMRSRILKAIADPNIAYLLMMAGVLGIYFELSNPGAIFPGVIGAVCLVLAFYSFQTLSVNYAGLLLIVLAMVFFIAEIKVMSYGLLSVAGIISLLLGSLMLFDPSVPYLKLSLWVVLPTVIFMSAFIIAVMYLAVRVFGEKPVSGMEGIVGEEGTALSSIEPEGRVLVIGEYWNAVSDEPIKKGDKIKVVGIKGLLVTVVRL